VNDRINLLASDYCEQYIEEWGRSDNKKFCHEHAGDTPYEDVVELAGMDVDSSNARSLMKDFITKAIASAGEHEARGAFISSKGTNIPLFNCIKEAAYKRYSNIVLFDGWGIKTQGLEGEILRKIMIEGVKLGIASLPVFDALAVNHVK
jgi:hypothetical protein